MIKEMEEILRRNRLDLNTPAELAIRNAVQEVEKIGADIKLTDAINLLGKAKELVSDFIDLEASKIKFLIYCYHVDKFFTEQNLVVGKAIAKNCDSAIDNYLNEIHPNNIKSQEFTRGYLEAIECNERDFELHDNDFESNRKKIGIWL